MTKPLLYVLLCFALLAGMAASRAALAQWVYLTPADGVAIRYIQPREDGWVMVTFADSFAELTPCFNVTMGPVLHVNPVWINTTAGAGTKMTYNTTMAAFLIGKKLRQATVTVNGTACMLVNVTVRE
jgi:hypothetical protein